MLVRVRKDVWDGICKLRDSGADIDTADQLFDVAFKEREFAVCQFAANQRGTYEKGLLYGFVPFVLDNAVRI